MMPKDESSAKKSEKRKFAPRLKKTLALADDEMCESKEVRGSWAYAIEDFAQTGYRQHYDAG